MSEITSIQNVTDDEIKNKEIVCPGCDKKVKISQITISCPWVVQTAEDSTGIEKTGGWLFPHSSPVMCPLCNKKTPITKFAEKDFIYAAINRKLASIRKE